MPRRPLAHAFGAAGLGPVMLRNRSVKAATFDGFGTGDEVTPELVEFHRTFAEVGA